MLQILHVLRPFSVYATQGMTDERKHYDQLYVYCYTCLTDFSETDPELQDDPFDPLAAH